MGKSIKKLLILATSLLILGSITFVGVMIMNKWDFKKLSTYKYQEKSYEISQDFSSILVKDNTANIVFAKSTDDKCRVDCFEKEISNHTAEVIDDTLTIQAEKLKWYQHIGIDFNQEIITVYLPKDVYDAFIVNSTTSDVKILDDFTFTNVNIDITTGDVCISNVDVNGNLDIHITTGDIIVTNLDVTGNFNINTTTGDVNVSNATCKNFTFIGSTGDVCLNNFIVEEKLNLKNTTGDVTFNKCDAGEIYVKTTTGDVNGSLLTEKVFVVSSTTGSKNVPNTTTGGKCEIVVTTGDINITID